MKKKGQAKRAQQVKHEEGIEEEEDDEEEPTPTRNSHIMQAEEDRIIASQYSPKSSFNSSKTAKIAPSTSTKL